MKNMIEYYGIPAMLYTDKRAVFEYKKSRSRSVEKNASTQFKTAMSSLGVEIKTTSVPQAKGKGNILHLYSKTVDIGKRLSMV